MQCIDWDIIPYGLYVLVSQNQVTLFADERVIYESQGGVSHALRLDLDTIFIKLIILNICVQFLGLTSESLTVHVLFIVRGVHPLDTTFNQWVMNANRN